MESGLIFTHLMLIAFYTYLMRSALKLGGVRWAFGFFPPGVVLRRSSVEEELSELRSYEMWFSLSLGGWEGD
jgi:hypothetical protein